MRFIILMFIVAALLSGCSGRSVEHAENSSDGVMIERIIEHETLGVVVVLEWARIDESGNITNEY